MAKIRGKQIIDDEVTATQAETSNGAISTVNAGDSAVEGSGIGLSRRDHQHAVATGGAASTVAIGDAAAEGSSSNLAREDHTHAVPSPAAPGDVDKSAASAGASSDMARADHKHDVSTAAAVELTDSTNAEGAATSLARSDHTHGHGNRSGGTLHAVVTTSVEGFMSAADKVKLDALVDPNVISPKDSVRLKSTGNVTLSGSQTVDGVSTSAGDRVAVFDQTTATQDGLYLAAAGAWTRTADFAAGSGQAGAAFPVEEGSTNADTLWLVTNDSPNDIVGTDNLVVLQIGSGSPRGAGDGLVLTANDLDVVAGDGSITVTANDITVGVISDVQHGSRGGGSLHDVATVAVDGFMSAADKTKVDGIAPPLQEPVTTEVVTGSDTALTDTLNSTPISNASVRLFLNGVLQEQGAGADYTVSATTITWLASSGTAVDMDTTDDLVAVYNG